MGKSVVGWAAGILLGVVAFAMLKSLLLRHQGVAGFLLLAFFLLAVPAFFISTWRGRAAWLVILVVVNTGFMRSVVSSWRSLLVAIGALVIYFAYLFIVIPLGRLWWYMRRKEAAPQYADQ